MAEVGQSWGVLEHPVLVFISASCQEDLSRKLQIYFQSKESEGGECKVTRRDQDTYLVTFTNEEDQRRALNKSDHVIKYGGIDLSVTLQPYEAGCPPISTQTERPIKGHNEAERSAVKNKIPEQRNQIQNQIEVPESQNDSTQQIFSQVTAYLSPALFSQEKREEVKNKFPLLHMRESTDKTILVTGTYAEIKELYRYLQTIYSKISENGSFSQQGEEKQREDSVLIPLALYEYFSKIYSDEFNEIKNRFKVKINHSTSSEGNVCVIFTAVGPDSRIEKANQCFTDKVQRITLDWSQEIVNLSQPKVSSTSDIKQSVQERCTKTLVIVKEDQVILRGPMHELLQAKRLVEDLINSAAPQRAVKITSHGMMGEISVDGRHLDILKQLRFRDINEIEQKYGVKMEEKPIDKKNVQVKFRAADGPPDLSVHACHTFLTLLHTTLTNTIKSDIKVKPGFQEMHLGLLHEQLKLEDTKIIVKNENNSVILIGSPNSVLSAKKILDELLKQEGPPKVMGAEGGGEDSVDTGKPASTKEKPVEKEDDCPICMEVPKKKKVLDKCKHGFCEDCIKKAMDTKPVCPVCNVVYGRVKGNQPDGRMNHSTLHRKLPGYNCFTIQIDYTIPNGIQGENHPNPGKPFSGAWRTAYLPDNTEGREILQLLKKAFNQKLIFTVGESRTSGFKDTVTWNDIHHKTAMFGGPSNFGYPDPDYLRRVRDELKAKGIE